MKPTPPATVCLAAALLIAFGATAAGAQGTSDTTARPAGARGAATTVAVTPAQPRQGSVIRITVQPADVHAAVATPMASGDTSSLDTLPSVTVVLRPQLDSLRAILDTLALRRDPTKADSTKADSTKADTIALGMIAADSARTHDIVTVRATLFGEPLHFERQPGGEFVALGAIPVDAGASLRLPIVVVRAGRPDTTVASLVIRRTAYKMEKMERLTVATRFGQKPDSALAARIAREQALAAGVSRNSHDTPRLWVGAFERPRTARVTSGFGDGREFNGAIQSRHMGLDLAGAIGAPVLATNRGVVALVGNFYYAGNAVYIDHGAGLVTAYFHLSAADVAKGDTVEVGTRIGRVGATGRVTGPHLHWVARYGSISIDPSTLLELDPPATAGTTPPPPPSSRDDQPSAG